MKGCVGSRQLCGRPIITYLKNVDHGSGPRLQAGFHVLLNSICVQQGAGRRKSGAYTIVREHFSTACNAAMGHWMQF